ncbi:hypothetical protein QMA77_09695 [Pantoea ananatis]|uniref:hypothetical protein n=1 Tax=Pantoea ananas TaxID=553 RepID=UPI0024ADEB34|nr:hypothetical protein [Pantoea ananatis]MDI6537204.1 hypothetical protein [Pantoea ananatis]
MKNKFSSLSGKELIAAGHQFGKSLDADAPLIEIAKLFSVMASRLDCAIARGDELQQKLDAVAAENARLKSFITKNCFVEDDSSDYGFGDASISMPPTPATDAYRNSVRAEGIHFAVNRMLAAWGAGFIEATPGEAADVAGAVLSALEFLPRAQPDELKREYADKVISEIRTGESKQ